MISPLQLCLDRPIGLSSQ